MTTISISRVWFRTRLSLAGLLKDCSGIAATEFAVIVPIMLVTFFGTIELSSGVAVDRKVTIVARTLSDLTSQSLNSVADANLQNFFAASSAILTPYAVTPTNPTISEIYVDDKYVAKIQWSISATIALVNGAPQATLQPSNRKQGDIVTTLPAELVQKQTWLIWSEVDYKYVPTIGYVMAKTGVSFHDVAFTRPRQSLCVDYPLPVAPAQPCTPVP